MTIKEFRRQILNGGFAIHNFRHAYETIAVSKEESSFLDNFYSYIGGNGHHTYHSVIKIYQDLGIPLKEKEIIHFDKTICSKIALKYIYHSVKTMETE